MIWRALVGAVLALALLPASASAQAFDPLEVDNTPKSYRSPQRFALEFKLGLYSPNIDSTPGLTGTPFADLFNNQYTTRPGQRPAGRPLTTIEFDWQFWHRFGSLGVGISVGYSGRSTHSFEYDPPNSTVLNPCKVPYCLRSADTTRLNVLPFTLELIYRFDVLALRYKVPLVPYVKAGVGYYLWFIQRGDGSLSFPVDNRGEKAIGGTPGWVFHPGIALLLDIFDKSAATALDTELGINHTYLFFEGNLSDISGMNGLFKNKMVLSDLTWNAGLAFEF